MPLKRANNEAQGPAIIFLPGIILPAEHRYAPLVRELGSGIQVFTKDLDVYEAGTELKDYSVGTEVEGLVRAADAAGLERFYLYGHSAGGAIALAFTASHPNRIEGLALDEPATDFSPETKAAWSRQLDTIKLLPEEQRIPAFLRAQVAPGVDLPSPPAGPAPDWMGSRPAGIEAFTEAMEAYVLPAPLSAYRGQVYYSFGSLTNPVWREMRDRLALAFVHFFPEEYEGLHHLNTSHAVEPGRVAGALRRVFGFGAD